MKSSNNFNIYKTVLLTLGFFLSYNQCVAQTVSINPAQEYQTIRGFGGMNAPGWIADLTPAQIETAFGNEPGQLGLSIMRMRIDPNSARWDQQVPAAVRASQLGAILLATPWSPPAYMKSNNSLINGGKLLTQYYGDYTTHLLNFAEHMSDNGAPLYAISIQNEPDWLPAYESCEWSGNDFVNYLNAQGSRFSSLKVVAAESLRFNKSYTDPILNSATARQHVEIIGGHLYGNSPSTPQDYPLARTYGKEIWMTEHYTESSNDADAWPLALDVGSELHRSMTANFNAYIWWYIRRFYGLIKEDGQVSKRGYIMSQYARFVRPGFIRIGATEKPYSDVLVTAYKGPNNSLVLVAVNTGSATRNLNVNLQNGTVETFVKYSTSDSLNVGYGGTYQVSNGATSFFVEPKSIATFVGESRISSSSSSSSSNSDTHNIVVRMRGISGSESVGLQVGGSTVHTWTLGTSMANYSASTNEAGDIRVVYTNDASSRDVQVDYISVNGQIRQAENQPINTGVWSNGACGGGGLSEWLHCNGYIDFGNVTSSSVSSSSSTSSNSPVSSANSSSSSSLNTSSSNNSGSISTIVAISNEWDSGYCANLKVTNSGSTASNWNVTVSINGTVNNLWNGTWSQAGSSLQVSGVAWNRSLQPGQTDSSIGFCASR